MVDADYYTPVHPDAYGGEPGLLAGLPGSWRRSPFVVDEPGVFVGGDGDEGSARLVPWESVHEVVRYRTTVRAGGDVRQVDAIGLRLKRRPDIVSVQRVLRGWSLERGALEAAVARFAPGVAVVDGPTHDPVSGDAIRAGVTDLADAVRESFEEGDDGVRRPKDGEPLYGPRSGAPATPPPERPHALAHGTTEPGSPEPGSPAAPAYGTSAAGPDESYIIRPDLSNVWGPLLLAVLGVAVAVGILVLGGSPFGLFFLALAFPLGMHILDARRGVVYFAVDAGGVYLGQSDAEHAPPAPAAPIRWESIASVIVFEVEERTRERDSDGNYRDKSTWRTAVGVTRPGGREGAVAHYQLFQGYRLDRPALERAVERYGDGVPVLDGPAIGERDLGDVAGALFDAWRNRGQP